ncbi:hypothetical protein [Aliarcobacter skirrowii]|uniref:Uncharacterized protein n=1 Tax=Aliarcobacter skirrowii CCUG 10374 TaxID=1032239 RepID=A0AAD0WMV1_9BACT|nr:hypothetical protein [Aliarcobacter skirrowii]AXX84238.1 hypothetical protein ASKIR_0403 [Aliarcobacter skirrowii CCUG 10374]KAB0621581.1 hypothetical protein F7P70_01695 [Aliarcobacter skirrowii CCUG 10374]RXI26834.1 hypothetical protein CP959_01695 [Aliarcobacter skirrowii CCUG 10374]SUV14395.1 Uncharacterised protein [Aliarcobacter skirrowii]
MKIEVTFDDWEQSLKESILENYNNSQMIEYKDSNATELLEKALQILRKNQQRLGKKKVFLSKEILENPLYEKFKNIIEEIQINFENGIFDNIYPRLSNKHKENIFYNDNMLNILNVEHFHLDEDSKAKEIDELLFVKYNENRVYFIDIFNHKNFLDKEIVEILYNNWNDEIEDLNVFSCENNNISEKISNKERYAINKNNVNVPYEIFDKNKNCKVLIRISGIMSNGKSNNEYINIMFIKRKINSFVENIDYFSNYFFKFIQDNDKNTLTSLIFSVIWLDSYGVCFFEKNSNIKFDVLEDGFRIFHN